MPPGRENDRNRAARQRHDAPQPPRPRSPLPYEGPLRERNRAQRNQRNARDYEGYLNVRRRLAKQREELMRLRRLAAQKRAEERRKLEERIKAQRDKIRETKDKNKDLMRAHEKDREHADEVLRAERQQRDEAQAAQQAQDFREGRRPKNDPERQRAVSGAPVGTEGGTALLEWNDWESSKNAAQQYLDEHSVDATDLKYVRAIIRNPKTGKPEVHEVNADEFATMVENSKLPAEEQINPLRPERVEKGWQLEGLIGTGGPLLVSNEGTTSIPVPGKTRRKKLKGWSPGEDDVEQEGYEWVKKPPETAMYRNPDLERPGEYRTIREQKEHYARLAVTNPEAYRQFQMDLAKAGYYGDDPDFLKKPVVSGVWDRETRKAINGFFWDATLDGPSQGKDFDDLLRDKALYMAEMLAAYDTGGGGGGGGGGGATSYSATDPATLALYAEDVFKNVTGRMPTPAEKAEAIAAVQAAEAAEGGKTSGAIVAVDPQAVMTEYARRKAPDESGAKNLADAFEGFAAMMGPGGAIGQGGGVISMGNPKIGS